MNRPLAGVEDLGGPAAVAAARTGGPRDLVAQGPSDFVTVNLTYVSDGNGVLPLVGMYRDERFPTLQQQLLQSLSDAITEVTELSDADQEAVAYSIEPKGVPAAEFDAEHERCRALLATSLDRAPAGCPPPELRR